MNGQGILSSPVAEHYSISENHTSVQKPIYSIKESNSKPKETGSFDWKTALLALLALLLAGGLIPFWLYIWFSLNSGR